MAEFATILGGSTMLSYTGASKGITAQAFASFNTTFSSQEVNAYYIGGVTVPPPSVSTNGSLIIEAPATNTTLPSGYTSVFDVAGSDSVNGGNSSLTAYLQGGLAKGTDFNTGSGNDLIYAGGADSVTAGSGANTIFGGSGSVTVQGGAGALYFQGGPGSVSVTGGQGNTTLLGGIGGSDYLAGGGGTNLLVAGNGAGSSTLVGGLNATEFAIGTGPVVMVAGTGTSLLNGLTGSGTETMFTGGGTALMALNGAADTVVGGSGHSTVVGGTGHDVYGFLAGHASGSEVIFNISASDIVVFGGYGGDPITSENVTNGSDVVTLSDNTTITFAGFDHKIFGNLG